MKIKRLQIAVVHASDDLSISSLNGQVLELYQDVSNQYDAFAIKVLRIDTLTSRELFVGYVSSSPHTTPTGCSPAKDVWGHIPQNQCLIARPVSEEVITMRNGDMRKVLIAEIRVMVKEPEIV